MRSFNLKRATLLAAGLAVALGACGLRGEALAADKLPDKATLSANRMRFDANTGDFLAEGNVTITAGGMTIAAPRGTGNIERQELLFDEGIAASGDWMGDRVDLKAGKLTLIFADTPTCRFQGGVAGGVGGMRLDADRLTLLGLGGIGTPTGKDRQTKFWLVKARRLEDRVRGLTFGADSVEGTLQGGKLHVMTAKTGVWLRGRPKGKGEPVSLKGDHALYSMDRGSVVLSGNVSAVQGGRTLKSDSIVYFPDQNRVEAMGGVVRRQGTVSADRAEITIDLNRENLKREDAKRENAKPENAKGGGAKNKNVQRKKGARK